MLEQHGVVVEVLAASGITQERILEAIKQHGIVS
jgi:hypothetical protein